MTQQTTTSPTSRPAHRGRRTLPPRWRKTILTLHVGLSVGWLGAAYTTIMFSLVAGWTSDPQLQYGAFLLLRDTNLMVMLPCSLLGLSAGLVLALFSPWRLVHYHWVLTKFTLAVAAILFAALYVSQRVATAVALTSHGATTDLGGLRWQVMLGSVGLVLVLAADTTLAVVKPWGRTRWGRVTTQQRG